jgi:hypothetical protein
MKDEDWDHVFEPIGRHPVASSSSAGDSLASSERWERLVQARRAFRSWCVALLHIRCSYVASLTTPVHTPHLPCCSYPPVLVHRDDVMTRNAVLMSYFVHMAVWGPSLMPKVSQQGTIGTVNVVSVRWCMCVCGDASAVMHVRVRAKTWG